MQAYDALAGAYDALTYDIPYENTLRFIQQIWQRADLVPQTVVDLACGTGAMSLLLARAGYAVTGVDLSEAMLTQASAKAAQLERNRPYFVRQDMTKLRLPQPVDSIVCLLDSVNYLTKPEQCRRMMERVYRSLRPGGMFVFDINTPAKLRALDGQVFLDETKRSYCVWRTEFDEAENICYYGVDLFEQTEELWRRSFEQHEQYAYTPDELCAYLAQAGFADVACYGDGALRKPEPDEQRVYLSAVRPQK